MKTLFNVKNLLIGAAIASVTFFNSCTTKSNCDNCPTGTVCVDGECVTDPAGNGQVTVTGFITSDQTWTADKIYVLDGRVVVRTGATLKIEPGTIIKGQNGTGTSASVLIIERGGKIDARGTAAKPIIFTSIEDNIAIGQLTGTNFNETVNQKWGGLIVLGKAPVSTKSGDVEGQIEGIPASETYGVYGGTDPNDNSGFIQYVSIRHGGITIGDGNEINGLTLGGVGAGTIIDHVEIMATLDDGIEFFGGTVNVSDAIVIYQGDDGFDIDQNYSGTLNNIMVVTGDGIGTDEALEIDGPEGSTYTSGLFTITNGTFIFEGTGSAYGADLKSKAQGNITLCSWQGPFTRMIAVAASFADTTSCTPKGDAYLYMTQTSPILKVYNCELVASSTMTALDQMATVYNASGGSCVGATEQAAIDMAITGGANTFTTSATKGANKTVFASWTWASIKGKI